MSPVLGSISLRLNRPNTAYGDERAQEPGSKRSSHICSGQSYRDLICHRGGIPTCRNPEMHTKFRSADKIMVR